MTLIDGDRIITAQLYDEQYEEYIEKKMSIIEYVNAYTDEGVTEADVVEQTRWIPVSERLPDIDEEVLVDDGTDRFVAWWVDDGLEAGWHSFDESYDPYTPILAWMPLPEPYKAESKIEQAATYADQDTLMSAT